MPRALRLILLGTLVVALMAFSCAAQKEVKRIDKDTLKGWLGRPDVVIIDVRSPQDWAASDKKIPGAVRREPGDVATWGQTLPKDKRIVAYCAWPNEATSARVALALEQMGHSQVMALKGGWKEWEQANYPAEAK